MKVKNPDFFKQTPLRTIALQLIEEALMSIDTAHALTSRVALDGNDLVVDGVRFPLPKGKLLVVGAGKCSADALSALVPILGSRLTAGFVIDVTTRPMPAHCSVVAGNHPYPTEVNVAHTRQLLSLLENLSTEDAVIFLISGGGTVLLSAPPDGFSVHEEAALVKLLFRGGADIHAMNTVRKHLSHARGGFLAKAAYPARSLALIFSDVPGDDLGFISSGPTVRDTTSLKDARGVLGEYGVNAPEAKKAESFLLETPKDAKFFTNSTSKLFMSNTVALGAMAEIAQKLGFTPQVKTHTLCGLAASVGERMSNDIALAPARSCLLWGGETTVRIVGSGIGGRNREVALSALKTLPANCLVGALASDGVDNGPCAGAVVDETIRLRAAEKKVNAEAYLANNDSHHFFHAVGGEMETGPTGSNVADLLFALKE